jgi:hemolysin activation/secretion protein
VFRFGTLAVMLGAVLALALAPIRTAAQQPPAAEGGASFDVLEFRVEGNTVLARTVIEKAVYPFLGPGRSVADVEKARAALEKAYHDAGYQTVSVSIPEQRVEDAVVTLHVTEGTVSRVRVTGARYYSQGRILEQAPSIAEGSVPNFTEVQKDLDRLNRSPDKRVLPVLRAGKVVGTTDIDLNVEDRSPLAGSLEYNNYASPNTVPHRITGTLGYNNLFQADHSVQLQYQTAPENHDEIRLWMLSYTAPLPASDRFLSAYAVHSSSSVAALADIAVLGAGDIVGLRYVIPLRGDKSYSHTLTLGVDYKSFKENLTQAGEPATQTPIVYWPFSVTYNGTRPDPQGSWQYSTGVEFSFRGFGSEENEFENKRFNARGNFLIFKWDVARTQTLGKYASLFARVDGQVADQPLVSNEQMYAGGVGSVRGYLLAEALGDNGVHGSLELRGPSLAGEWAPRLNELRPYVFTEGAHLSNIDPLPTQQQRATLSSAGFGLGLKAFNALSAVFNYGWPFHSTLNTQARDPRWQFRVLVEF